MDRYVEKTGKNVDEAIEKALEELDADRDSVEIEVLEEGTRNTCSRKIRPCQESLKNRKENELQELL